MVDFNQSTSGLLRAYRSRGLYRTLEIVFMQASESWLHLPINGLAKELLFWEKQLMGVGYSSENFFKRLATEHQKSCFPNQLNEYIDQQRLRTGRIPQVLDVGAGPVSQLLHAHRQGKIVLTTADILADDYKRLLEDYGYANVMSGVETYQIGAESLVEALGGQVFDIVHCNNALDHTDRPIRSLEQMVTATAPGGFIIVSGHSREGSQEDWDGIHMHDLYVEQGVLYHETRDGVKTRMDTELDVTTYFAREPTDPYDDMFIAYQKM